MQMFTSLKEAGVIEVGPGRRVRVNTDLQQDFSLIHALSLYLLETIEQLERVSETYALDLLTLVESILENPEMVLMRQLDKIKTEKMAEMKAAGVEYDQRIEELDKLEYPKPNKDFVYDTFNAFASRHPWIGQENIRPKSIARELFETFSTFPDYVKDYGLERGEDPPPVFVGHVQDARAERPLGRQDAAGGRDRHLLRRDRPPSRLELARRVGRSSARRRRRRGTSYPTRYQARRTSRSTRRSSRSSCGTPSSRSSAASRAATTRRRRRCSTATRKPDALEAALAPFWAEHTAIRTDARARSPEHTRIVSTDGGVWRVEQVVVDAEDANDWAAFVTIDLARSKDAARPVMTLERLGT